MKTMQLSVNPATGHTRSRLALSLAVALFATTGLHAEEHAPMNITDPLVKRLSELGPARSPPGRSATSPKSALKRQVRVSLGSQRSLARTNWRSRLSRVSLLLASW